MPVAPEQVIPVLGEAAAGPTRTPRTAITRPRWETRYARAVAASDLAAMVVSLGLREWWGQPAATSSLPLDARAGWCSG